MCPAPQGQIVTWLRIPWRACAQALEQVRKAQMGSLGVAAAGFLALVACLGRGAALLSTPVALCTLGIAVGAVAAVKLRQVEAQFVFTDWVNAHK